MYMCIYMFIVHISIYVYDIRDDGDDDVPPRLVADPVEGVEGCVPAVSTQAGIVIITSSSNTIVSMEDWGSWEEEKVLSFLLKQALFYWP